MITKKLIEIADQHALAGFVKLADDLRRQAKIIDVHHETAIGMEKLNAKNREEYMRYLERLVKQWCFTSLCLGCTLGGFLAGWIGGVL